MPSVTIEIKGLTLTVPEHLHAFAYLARVFEVGSNEPKALRLSTNLDDCYTFLDEKLVDRFYGDIAVYDIQFAGTKKPTMIKTLPSRRM
ncbi:hypothetical protein AB0B89_30930 [Sphaerisporangium sp. NPDC049002]|uniref:hypothetical protein n=1 Tax=Sphaerisporangium sp. NPDC049002 TaxID=3155392 RepID=UPI00340EF85D